MLSIFFLFRSQPLMFWDTLYYLTPNGRSYLRNIDYVHQVASDVINKRRINLVRSLPFITRWLLDSCTMQHNTSNHAGIFCNTINYQFTIIIIDYYYHAVYVKFMCVLFIFKNNNCYYLLLLIILLTYMPTYLL